MAIKVTVPFDEKQATALKAGDNVLITGVIYTARDAAHKRMTDALKEGKPLPMDVRDGIIYYAGPTPSKPGQIIGSCGPTTAGRVDSYTPEMLDCGLRGMIGKGERSPQVVESMCKNKCVYFAAIGGLGALISKCVEKMEIVAYEDLGCEAVRRLTVKDFPAVVVIDSQGRNLYRQAVEKYASVNEG